MYLWLKTRTHNCGSVSLSRNVTIFMYLFVFLFTYLHILQVIIFIVIVVVAHSVVACFLTIINILAYLIICLLNHFWEWLLTVLLLGGSPCSTVNGLYCGGCWNVWPGTFPCYVVSTHLNSIKTSITKKRNMRICVFIMSVRMLAVWANQLRLMRLLEDEELQPQTVTVSSPGRHDDSMNWILNPQRVSPHMSRTYLRNNMLLSSLQYHSDPVSVVWTSTGSLLTGSANSWFSKVLEFWSLFKLHRLPFSMRRSSWLDLTLQNCVLRLFV